MVASMITLIFIQEFFCGDDGDEFTFLFAVSFYYVTCLLLLAACSCTSVDSLTAACMHDVRLNFIIIMYFVFRSVSLVCAFSERP